MKTTISIILLSVFIFSGCDQIEKITNPNKVDPKTLDDEAVGFACRVAKKGPEPCMQENEERSTSAILKGWTRADNAINKKELDPDMTGNTIAAIKTNTEDNQNHPTEQKTNEEKSNAIELVVPKTEPTINLNKKSIKERAREKIEQRRQKMEQRKLQKQKTQNNEITATTKSENPPEEMHGN